MDGVGGGTAEVNWSRYSGVRRTKFVPERDGAVVLGGPRASGDRLSVHVSSDRRASSRAPRNNEMWTEITKDLVSREAIRRMGYAFEETRWFYYIMEYLRQVCLAPQMSCSLSRRVMLTTTQEDVQQLIQMSDDIRRARRLKSRQARRDDIDVHIHRHKHRHEHSPSYSQFVHEDGRFVERQVVVDRKRYY
jgi:hypothetical protein